MFRWLKNVWIDSATVEFVSAFDLTESVERLRTATKRSVFSAIAREAAVGTVKENRVSLQRVIPMMGNSFKPFFVGRFEESGGKVVLHGRFTMHWFVKLFMTMWFGSLVLIAIGILAGPVHSRDGSIGLAFIVIIGMLGAGLGLVRVGQWFSRNDRAWLSDVISAALGAPAVARTATEPFRSLTHGLPIHLLAFAVLVSAGGVVALVSGATGIQTFRLDSRGAEISYFGDASTYRYLILLSGAVMLAWAYGIYRRLLFAWWVGFGVFAFGGFQILAMTVRTQSTVRMPIMLPQPLTIVFAAVALLVLAIWAWWWYAQRVHFFNE